MSDDSDKRAPKPFEPPPWEKDQFEELRRRREEAEAAEKAERQLLAGEAAELARAREASEKAVDAMDDPIAGRDMAVSEADVAAAQKTAEADAKRDGGADLDPRVVDAMLIQLSGEDTSALKPMKRAGMWVGYVVGAVGVVCLVLTIVSLVIFSKSGAQVYGFGAAMLGVIGIFCGGVAVWLYYLSKR
jgi:hypothetical protein